MNPAHLALRQGTADAHDVVDAAFGRFDLGRADDYQRFLQAQARVLLPLEARLVSAAGLPPWRPRRELLVTDLETLGAAVPEPMLIGGLTEPGALHGALYVMEGSRLGGGLLARRVGAGLPRAFLGATHLPGEWRTLMAAIDAAAVTPQWQSAMLAGARSVFDHFAEAARAFSPVAG